MGLIRLSVRNTGRYGAGVFADESIQKGGVIAVLDGEVITFEECVQRCKREEEYVDDPLQIGMWEYLDLDEFSRSFNHSCWPNAGLRKRSELFALRAIRVREEITYDYSATVGPNITAAIWEMPCACRNKRCRGVLGNVLTLPKSTIERYRKAGAFQDWMLEVLAEDRKQIGHWRFPGSIEESELRALKNGGRSTCYGHPSTGCARSSKSERGGGGGGR